MTQIPARPERPSARPPRPEPKAGILGITPYKPGKAKAEGFEHPIKLSSNENILGSSPKAHEAFIGAADRMHLYPDGRANGLRAAVAERFRLEPDRLVFGCGTDEIFALLDQAFLEPGDNIVMGEHGFSAYAIGARACQAEVRYAPEDGYRVSVDAMLAEVDERTRLMFIANPANPTGTSLSAAEIRRLHDGLPGDVILVLDGAYAEFNADPTFDDGIDLARGAGNVVVTHTFSKLHGLAALRVGWAYCPEPIADAIDRIRMPFNISIAAQEAAIAALGDEDFQRRSLEHVERWRPWLIQQLGGLGFDVAPSTANFILFRFAETPGKTAAEAEAFLASRGMIVRGVANYGLPDCLRVTIGLEEHNRALIEALSEFLSR